MTQNAALVSIGLPVYNAEGLIRRALDALLAQDYPHFELIISDNASTDDTWNICQQYQSQDSRIRLFRNETNIGASNNFERVFSLATGEYFMWAAHDDWWESSFIRQCAARLESDPRIVLCHVIHVEVDEASGESKAIDYEVDLETPSVWQRCFNLMTALAVSPMPNVYIYGLFRREPLARTMPLSRMIASDTITLLEVLQQGIAVGVDEPLHHYTLGRRGRGTRAFIKQYAPNIHPLNAITWDWRLFFILFRLSQVDAPDFRARLRGAWAAGRLVHSYTGWPLSIKMFMNYAYILMPESLAKNVRRWVDTHPRVERFIMRLVKKRKAVE